MLEHGCESSEFRMLVCESTKRIIHVCVRERWKTLNLYLGCTERECKTCEALLKDSEPYFETRFSGAAT